MCPILLKTTCADPFSRVGRGGVEREMGVIIDLIGNELKQISVDHLYMLTTLLGH